ncbi:DinB family protein [Bacillus sporothermodurans]|uniref:DinB family protein n=1 Tax=Heyndrickxia sporothermodurans TaxID=46224 RepID=A0AB37H6N4_9BACI|nr:DinB family protein [Heyndrickxia sporothermodurans]MBL5769357.1 DinB family protein [Heyndrickxia sporothermodurans]MBL5773139.1 DinB family protein [Heyndrickxia sporothermodurans]MBL5776629.1 DinB family protein [Heyndrickxia sporothermodurans]MBL5780143.1 DinB family protein [Heyndrickxia sporothermodurans]MBL5783729.1 DinB family protein [Heyndrickxia sporothermodurans]
MEKYEYEWVKQTRQILLDQCKEIKENDFTKESGFGFQSIRDSLVHVAGCYHAWLGSFALSETTSPLLTKEAIDKMQIDDIQRYFQQADKYVNTVFERFTDTFDDIIEKELSWKVGSGTVRKTPHQLLTHSITHEFHHKGQIVAMLRLFGYIPKNTDILGLPEKEFTKQ